MALSGAIAGGVMLVAAQRAVAGITPQTSPAVWPTLPWLPTVGILLGLVPAWFSPLPPLRAAQRAQGPENTRAQDIYPRDVHSQSVGSQP